ncbi:MAG: EamA family transporter, partial [Bacteroidota bacterium]
MPTALFTLATLFWGASFIFIKVALNEVSPLSFIFLRFLIASMSLLPLLRYQREKIGEQDLYKGIQLGCLLGAVMLFQTIGVQTINASTAAFLVSFTTV